MEETEEKVTKEEISMTGFAIVAYAGDARTALIKASKEASQGHISKARELSQGG